MRTIVIGAVMATFLLPALTPAEAAGQTFSVSMTGYNAEEGQTDDTPTVTASGASTIADVVAARSSDLADELPFGTIIQILPDTADPSNSCGASLVSSKLNYRVIADSMHPRKRNQIDVFFGGNDSVSVGKRQMNAARALGICKGVSIRVVGKLDIRSIPKNRTELAAAVNGTKLASAQ